MTPAARAQAAIELLDLVIAATREDGAAADTLIQRYFASRRYAGAKDRRAVRELVYAAIRHNGEPPVSGRAAIADLALRPGVGADEIAWLTPELFTGAPHAPQPLDPGEQDWRAAPYAGWATGAVLAALDGVESELDALLTRAPLDVRVNSLLGPPEALGIGGEPIAGVPDARRLPAGTSIGSLAGRVEVQDAGSQMATLAGRAVPGQQVVDLCAGAGGKTLALAAAMANEGHILACDTDRARLSRLRPRAVAAGVTIAEARLLDPSRELDALTDWRGRADTVLIDAPCSGTGTWRRNPEARWRLTPARLSRLVAAQSRLLDIGAALVRPGGALVYVVCSLLDDEGSEQAAAFATRHPGWTAESPGLPAGRPRGPGVRLTPAHDGTDGFFVARFRAPC